MDGVYLISKRVGESMGQLVERFAGELGIDTKVTPVTFAGRLDPLAEGLCILLVGSFVHEKEKYLAYDKAYTGTFVTGIATDTYDIAGMPSLRVSTINREDVLEEIKNWTTYTSQVYPMYSSKPVDGKPLWVWARDGQIPPSGVPSRTIVVSESDGEYVGEISLDELCKEVKNLLNIFPSDFRQDEIGKAWSELDGKESLIVYSFSVTASSGTYVRGLVQSLGERSVPKGTAISTISERLRNREPYGAALKTLCRQRIGPFSLSPKLQKGDIDKIV